MNYTFKSPQEFAAFIEKNPLFNKQSEKKAISEGLEGMCEFLVNAAKEKFGHYQTGWEELADATKKDRLKKGYNENDPLLREGDLRDSVKFSVVGNNAFVGSTSEIMVYQEEGTTSTGWGGKGIPPRPIFLITQILDGRDSVGVFASIYLGLLIGQ